MADIKSGNKLDKWRNYFRTCNSDIFDIIENGILIAACDNPQEFKLKRDQIAETLFSSRFIKCVGCEHVELCVPTEDRMVEEGGKVCGESKESKVDSGSDGRSAEMNVNTDSYRDAEALTAEIEEESKLFGEMYRIKRILENSKDEADSLVLDSLRRLELMPLSIDMLKATEIGKAVNALRKHASTDIRNLARTLIEVWKVMVDEWATATAAIAGGLEGDTPESVNPSAVDQVPGLPSPPLEDFAFFNAYDTSFDISEVCSAKFFDGLDDFDPTNCVEFNKNTESGRKPRVGNDFILKPRQQLPAEYVTPPKFKKEELTTKEAASMKIQTTLPKSNKPSMLESGAGRLAKPSSEYKARSETKLQKNSELSSQRPPVPQQHKTKYLDEDAVQQKLESTKRKLQESYQQAENAKKQRTIQVVELHDIPKQGFGHRNSHAKPGNNGSHNRQWANGRR